jgi:hypothetical protein
MFRDEILRLYAEGFTASYIANRLGVATGYVRSVVSAQTTGCEVKPAYNAVADLSSAAREEREHKAAVEAARKALASRSVAQRRAAALAKQAEALKVLAELEAGGA